MLGLALMFPAYFVLTSSLASSQDLPIDRSLIVIGLITAAVFGGIPVLMMLIGRVRWSSGFALRRPAIGAVLGALVLGVVLWPFAHEIFLFSKLIGLSVLGKEQMAEAETLIQKLQSAPLWLVLVCLGLAPAVFEELCFRGFLFSALRTRLEADRTVIVSSLMFGLFHEIFMPGRLLTSTFLGGVLGWVRVRSRSVFPGMFLHATHNGLLLAMAHYRRELNALEWLPKDQEHLPILWLFGAAVGALIASALVVLSTSRPKVRPVLRETRTAG
jgi:ABC-2 type transport system permease protein/sodium transport system permease protein